jgi:hypothetical protein
MIKLQMASPLIGCGYWKQDVRQANPSSVFVVIEKCPLSPVQLFLFYVLHHSITDDVVLWCVCKEKYW